MPTVPSKQNSNHNNKTGQFIPVKVVDVVLDMSFPDIEKIGGWDALGTILYIKISDIVDDPEIEYNRNNRILISSNNLARPLFSNTKYYPLKGEIVLIFSTTGRDIIKDKTETYYFPNINIWNHPHHNALPNPNTYNGSHPKNNNDKTKNDYVKSSGGLVRQVQDGDSEIPLGSYFEEQLNTKPLLPFEGDHIVEGRYGNSIRFGATAPGPNDWSTAGKIGDPITIIRNGQSDELDNKGWEPTTEDVNRDPSSIYLTSTQKLDKFIPASLNWQSWGAKPTIVEDPIEALSSPVIEEYTEPEPSTSKEDIISALEPETAEEIKKEEEIIAAEDNVTPAPVPEEKEEEQDELSFYDELINSGDYDEEDFDVVESEEITGAPISIDFPAEISATDQAVLIEIGETQTSTYRSNGTLDTEMLIGKYWKLSSLIRSSDCIKYGWSNIPGQDINHKSKWSEQYIISNLENLMLNVGDKLYEKYGKKMRITSGYRAKKLNDSLGSSDSSQHPQGAAIDCQFKGVEISEVFNWVIANIPSWSQMIWEKPEKGSGAWLHISYQPGHRKQNVKDIYTGKEHILAHYENRGVAGRRRTNKNGNTYMNIDRANQSIV